MALVNLNIRRVCLHEVHRRNEERASLPPTYAAGLLDLDAKAKDAFASRVHAAFKNDAQCMEMSINLSGEGSVADLGAKLTEMRDPQFVNASREFADLLAARQVSRSIPGGLVVVFDGTVGNQSNKFFGIMKAELHEGFLKSADLKATFVENLFLSPKNKLYKIGIFVANDKPATPMPDGWTATLYDKQMSASNRDGAAGYFHSSYLGLEIPVNSAHQVKRFFDLTREFIASSDLDNSEKTDLHNSLYTYLKVDRAANIQTGTFANQYLDDDLADDYRAFMRRERFPTHAIDKDLSEVQGRLRVRRFRFPQKIVLYGPPDAINDLVTVETVEGEAGQDWTRITVKGSLEGQE